MKNQKEFKEQSVNIYSKVIEAVIDDDSIKRAVKYVNPKFIIRVTRRGKKPSRYDNIDLVLTIGKPNFIEREFIRICQKAKEPFPVKKIQFKVYNSKLKINKK